VVGRAAAANRADGARGLRWEIWFCIAALIGGTAALWSIARHEVPRGMRGERPLDFAHYYVGAARVRRGENPYPPVATDVERLLGVPDYRAPVADTPAMLVVLAPLAWFAYPTGWLAFAAGSLAVAAGSGVFVARAVRLGWPAALGVAGTVLASRPFRHLLFYNHAEWLLLIPCVGGWWLARRGRAAGGLLWGLAAAMKLFPGMLLVASLLGRPRRVAAWALAGACAASAAGVAVVGWEATSQFLTVTVPRSRDYYYWSGNASLMAVGTLLAGRPRGGMILTALGLAAIVAALARRPGGVDRAYVAGTAAGLILSPLSWLFYGILAFPPLVLLGARVDWRSSAERIGFVVLAAVLVFWPLGWMEDLPLTLPTFLALVLPRLAAHIALFAWALRALD